MENVVLYAFVQFMYVTCFDSVNFHTVSFSSQTFVENIVFVKLICGTELVENLKI